MNPFKEKPKMSGEESLRSWKGLYPKPYNKNEVDPWTKCRIILMNGIEVESAIFGHNFHRNCPDQDVRRQLAMARRVEQQQQKTLNWLSPGDETQLETTIGYEHVAVDLTSWLAQHEPDPYVRACLDFALLEDFDHLYRYANLLKMDKDIPVHKLVQDYVEATPGRPTIAHHRHPFDAVKRPCNFKTADLRTKLNTLIITAGEQQTMNYYMNIGPTYENDPGRQLYMEIGMVEEQHVTHYGALLDPNCTWFENLLLHEYTECYLNYSFYMTETDPYIKQIWEYHFMQEVEHVHDAMELLEKYEGKNYEEVLGCDGEFPELLEFYDVKDYVREVLESQIELTADKEEFADVNDLEESHEFFKYNQQVNGPDNEVASHFVISMMQEHTGEDFRSEVLGENPVPELQDRTEDNTQIARMQMAQVNA